MAYLINRQALAAAGVDQQTIEALARTKQGAEQSADALAVLSRAPVVMLGSNGGLPSGRTLRADEGLALEDGGAGGAARLYLENIGPGDGLYGSASKVIAIAVDQKGRITAAQAFDLNSDNVTEGSANIFFTDARARAALSGADSINYDPVTGEIATTQTLDSGAYTPTATAIANVTAFTSYDAQYLRVGSTVTVSGRVDVTPAAAGALTRLKLSLPVPSALAQNYQLAGTAVSAQTSDAGVMLGNTDAPASAELRFVAPGTVSLLIFYSYACALI